MKDISVVIPVFNEGGAISLTLKRLFETIEQLKHLSFEIIVVNDSSTDGTSSILLDFKKITVLNNPYNLGYGASLKRGIREAKGKWIFIVDADGTYPIDSLPQLTAHMNEYDMVVGARTTATNEDQSSRRPAKAFLNWVASYLADMRIPDLNSGMRLFKKDLCLEFWSFYPQRFSFTSTITMAFVKSGYTIKYVPIDYFRRSGRSSIVPTDFFKFLAIICRIAFYFEPMKFFVPPSLIAVAIGLIKGSYDLYTQNFVGNFSIFLMVAGFLLVILALLADLISKRR